MIAVDVDAEELKKPTLHVELPVHADAKDFLQKMDEQLPEGRWFVGEEWLSYR